MIDFQKAFNRQNHLILINLLGDIGVPWWLHNIVVGFLQERELIVTHNGAKSESKEMPGGGPQGTVLGMLSFIILINNVGFNQEDRNIGEYITRANNAHKVIETMHAKYVDHLSVAEALILKNVPKVEEENKLIRTLIYHQRTEQRLKEGDSKHTQQLKDITEYANINEMKKNRKKTKLMVFNTSKTNDCQPELKIDEVKIEVVKEMKLLGVIITYNWRWHENTNSITKKAFSPIWVIRRLRNMGASKSTLLDVYNKQIRCVVEYATVVWDAGLTTDNINQIEKVQKSVFCVILGDKYTTYEEAFSHLNMKTERRK